MKKILILLVTILSFGQLQLFAFTEGVDDQTVLYQDIYNNYVNKLSEPDRSHYAKIMFDRCMRQVGTDTSKTLLKNGFVVNPNGPDDMDDGSRPFWN